MRFVFLLCITVALAACQTSRPAENASIRTVVPQEAVDISASASVLPASTMTGGNDGRFDVLALSGGGADGVYSVGVLNGWTRSGTRPEFDIVTGVSTGALVSVFAFLGPKYDALLRTLYLDVQRDDILRERGLRGLFGDALFDNTPLKKRIEQHVTPALLDEIAAEHRRGRRLYVATVNLDGGNLVVWDMGALASGEDGGRADALLQFQKVLRASAAIPVFFPPVYIKPTRGVQLRQAHVDGAIKAPVVLSDFLFESDARRRTIWIIINGQLSLRDADAPIDPNLRSIAAKSVDSLTRQLSIQTVYRGWVRARNSGTGYRITAIPDEIPPLGDPLAFDKAYLQRIYDLGERGVRRQDFWQTTPPSLQRFDRVAASR